MILLSLLRVVLSNGDVIETKRLNKRELNKKLGLSTFEGEIYRTIDSIVEDNQETIKKLNLSTTKNAAGYNLNLVKRKDGSFDLTPLFIGSQGTLGLITEATLTSLTRHAHTTLILVKIEKLSSLQNIILEIRKLPDIPSVVEVVDKNLLEMAHKYDPGLISSTLKEPMPNFVLLVEIDDDSDSTQKKTLKRLTRIFKENDAEYQAETDSSKKEDLWKLRESTTAVLLHGEGNAKPLPIIEDGIVPPENLAKFISGVYEIFRNNNMEISVYGHAGDGHLHIQPILDVGQVGHRQKIFKLMEEYYKLVLNLDGSITGEHGEGRLRTAFLPLQYGADAYELLTRIKQTFDPHGILNPGVKIGGNIDTVKPLLRDDYSLGHLYSYLPHI